MISVSVLWLRLSIAGDLVERCQIHNKHNQRHTRVIVDYGPMHSCKFITAFASAHTHQNNMEILSELSE